MSAVPLPPTVKGWCPGALRPMESGDGWIVRLRVTGGILPAERLAAIGAFARRYGNGLVDLTRRSNLQVRGVQSAALGGRFAAVCGLSRPEDDPAAEAVRNIVPPPLAGLDPTAPIDGLALVRELDDRLRTDRRLHALPGKFGFLVDDGGRLGLGDVAADIRLTGIRHPRGPRVRIALGGDRDTACPVAEVAPERAVETAVAVAWAFLALRGRTGARRMAGLVQRLGVDAVAAEAGLGPWWGGDDVPVRTAFRAPTRAEDTLGDEPAPVLAPADRRTPLSAVVGRQQGFLGVAAPFGRLSADQIDVIAALGPEARLTPWRALLLPGAGPEAERTLADAGLIVDPQDPRLAVTACPGAPTCPSGQVDTRGAAETMAKLFRGRAGEGIALHVSGCTKGCARSEATAATLVGSGGRFDLVVGGRADGEPVRRGLDLDEAMDAVEAVTGGTRTAMSETAAIRSGAGSDGTIVTGASGEAAYDYVRDGAEIYRRSFSIIRAEADLGRFSADEEKVAVRIIHACGMVEVAGDIVFTAGAVAAAKAALLAGAPILCDAKMVANGVTRARLPRDNAVICTLDDPRVPALAAELGTTRSAAAMELWREQLSGAVVAIGNAPTALFRLFEMIDAGAPLPAAVIGMPVGFVGAAESKEALLADGRFRALVVRGRKGGSAMAAAAVNALASERE